MESAADSRDRGRHLAVAGFDPRARCTSFRKTGVAQVISTKCRASKNFKTANIVQRVL